MQKSILLVLFCCIVFSDVVIQVLAHLDGDFIALDLNAEKETKLEKEEKKLEMKDFFISSASTSIELSSATSLDYHTLSMSSFYLEVQSPPPEQV